MEEFNRKEISFQFLKLSKETQKMEEDMKIHNSKIEITNMIAIQEEAYRQEKEAGNPFANLIWDKDK